ncbi:MAG: TIGR03435 family protein [Terracidiphilus sp.]|jgi:uncharacterized protein (TIGR03435 family)
MIECIAPRTIRRRITLLTAACLFVIAHSGAAQAPATKPTDSAPSAVFEAASIKPQAPSSDGSIRTMVQYPANGRLTAAGATVKSLICIAYGLSDFQVLGGPNWIEEDRYDVQATPGSALEEQLQKMTSDENTVVKHQMLQALLADRFKLIIHHDTKELPIYALVVAKGGPKLTKSKPDDANSDAANASAHPSNKGRMRMSFQSTAIEMTAEGMSMDGLARQLASQLGSTVQNQTGLKGIYDVTLRFTPDEARLAVPNTGGAPASLSISDNGGTSIFAAVQDQLGLKLESKKGPVEVVVVDHVDKPSDN